MPWFATPAINDNKWLKVLEKDLVKDVFFEDEFVSNVHDDLEEEGNTGRESLRRLRLNRFGRRHEKKGERYIKYKYVKFLDHVLILFIA